MNKALLVVCTLLALPAFAQTTKGNWSKGDLDTATAGCVQGMVEGQRSEYVAVAKQAGDKDETIAKRFAVLQPIVKKYSTPVCTCALHEISATFSSNEFFKGPSKAMNAQMQALVSPPKGKCQMDVNGFEQEVNKHKDEIKKAG